MIEQQPAFGRLDRDRSRTHLRALPAAFSAHDKTVLSPMDHVRALAEVDVTEWRVAVVARAAEHDKLILDLAREEHAIAVERQQRIFQEREFLEIEGIADPNRGAVVAIAPGNIIAILEPENSRVISVLEGADLRIITFPLDRVIVKFPMDAIVAKTAVEINIPFFIVTAENTRELPIEWDDGAVEDAVRGRDQVAGNDRVCIVPPDNITVAGRSLLPGNIGKGMVRHLEIVLYAKYVCHFKACELFEGMPEQNATGLIRRNRCSYMQLIEMGIPRGLLVSK